MYSYPQATQNFRFLNFQMLQRRFFLGFFTQVNLDVCAEQLCGRHRRPDLTHGVSFLCHFISVATCLHSSQFKDNIGSFHIAKNVATAELVLAGQTGTWGREGELVRGGSSVLQQNKSGQLFSQDAFCILFFLGSDHVIRLNRFTHLCVSWVSMLQ